MDDEAARDPHEFSGGEPAGLALPSLTWLTALVAYLPAIVMVSDAQDRVIYMNTEEAGDERGAFLGRCLDDYVLPADRQLLARTREEVWRTGERRQLVLRAETGGELRWYDVTIGAIQVGGRVVALVAVALDATARHAAEAHSRAQEALLAEAEAIAAIGSFALDLTDHSVVWSEGLFHLLGLVPDGAQCLESYLAMVDPAFRAEYASELAEIMAAPRRFELEHRIVRRDGEPRVFRIRGRPEPPDGLPPRRLIGVVQDVTEQCALDRAKSEFVSTVSHELRTPLTTIRAPLLMLQRGMVDPREPGGQEILGLAVQSAERMTRLVDDIFDYDRLTSGRLTMRRRLLDLGSLARQAVDALRGEAMRAGVEFSLALAPTPVTADADRLVQVFTNLLVNAVKFSPGGGTVRLAVAREGDLAHAWVRDDGPGIAPEHHEAIFERFHQVDSQPARRARGTGLGLAISRESVSRHGGRIWVESKPGHGATFHFTLPAGV